MTGRPLTGILLAVLVESARWTKFRWDFNEAACARAWQFTTIAIALAAVLVFLDGTPYEALPNLLTWLPALLLPMQFVQSYGLSDSMPVNIFSFLASHRRKRNLRLGLTESVIHVNFGNIYFVTAMIAATLGRDSNSWLFLPGIIILTGWMLMSTGRSRPAHLLVALTVAGGIAIAGQLGIKELQALVGNSAPGQSTFDPNYVSTSVGKPGKFEQSPDIVWRLRPVEKGLPPALLRTATYNAYDTGRWKIRPVIASTFKDLDTLEPAPGEIYQLLTANLPTDAKKDAVRAGLPRFKLRGAAFAETPLALPGDAASVRDFELDGIESNSLGTVRVFPKNSVIEGTVLWQGGSNPESPPFPEDLVVLTQEEDVLDEVLLELRLNDQPTLREKLQVIRGWFQQNFSYTRTLTISNPGFTPNTPTAVGQFLTLSRQGHCEYFATATTLLLRRAKIPARYAIGYAVKERDAKRNEFVIRGTHGHAWCRVWDKDARQWIDLDTTPGSWLANLAPQTSAMQRFNDQVKRIREDFFLWRNRPTNRLAVTLVMSSIALGVLAFIVKRLWRSKRLLEAATRSNGYEGPVSQTPLNALEQPAEKCLGHRPPGQPLGDWLTGLRPALTDASILDEAIELHQRLRFDPQPREQAERERLAELAKQLETAIKEV
ncbi:MAG: transglutaminase-like domain-containing protein [Verrucomicrobiota bacterium]